MCYCSDSSGNWSRFELGVRIKQGCWRHWPTLTKCSDWKYVETSTSGDWGLVTGHQSPRPPSSLAKARPRATRGRTATWMDISACVSVNIIYHILCNTLTENNVGFKMAQDTFNKIWHRLRHFLFRANLNASFSV